MNPCELNEVVKTQQVRLLDVFVIAPLMVYGGVKAGGVLGWTLAAFGATTLLYNAENYRRVADSIASVTR